MWIVSINHEYDELSSVFMCKLGKDGKSMYVAEDLTSMTAKWNIPTYPLLGQRY